MTNARLSVGGMNTMTVNQSSRRFHVCIASLIASVHTKFCLLYETRADTRECARTHAHHHRIPHPASKSFADNKGRVGELRQLMPITMSVCPSPPPPPPPAFVPRCATTLGERGLFVVILLYSAPAPPRENARTHARSPCLWQHQRRRQCTRSLFVSTRLIVFNPSHAARPTDRADS
jgi:hypothetical protein